MANPEKQPFLSDVKTLRARARELISKVNITGTYVGDAQKTIDILQAVLATELVCVLRYTMHAVTATGISSEGVKAEFEEHAKDEQGHAMEVAERINQLGGKPNFNPEGILTRSASQYVEGADLVEMIRENLIAERIAVDHYRELIRYFGDNDPATRVMIEGILSKVEEHTNVMHDLRVAHEGKPLLKASFSSPREGGEGKAWVWAVRSEAVDFPGDWVSRRCHRAPSPAKSNA